MTTQPTWAIETSGLIKAFNGVKAVDGLDVRVPAGVVYGILGPNGSGKSTTVRMLATLLRPDGGTARVFGHDVTRDPDAVRRLISVTGQYASVDEGLTGLENLVLMGRLQGYSWARARARAVELVETFGLGDARDRLLKTYSGGMRRRLDIAASIVVTPDLLFLDEPTTGLDPRSRNQVWDIVRALVVAGTTVLLTTQYLDEADHLADRIAVIDHGRVIAEGTTGELKSSLGSDVLRLRLHDAAGRAEAERVLSKELGVMVDLGSDPTTLTARVSDSREVMRALAALSRTAVEVRDFSLGQSSLDEVFMALTGHTTESQSNGEASQEERAA
ncbi:ATP-binding cassette domain-containing protein [Streptomyces sp. CA-278952]|uniref:daunorubicin/doxorubicin transporter ATP-binding protein DrrA n=1 Tax=unclassified Streptomyces TaxID=2593676 RepID=UPI0023686BC6|nr:daunorubicin/doxorubicin transporter ATP-binding protein DrrA [Streptomyces sp. CA-278952]WDG28512.1 ATP-binding cassette domain-containing protein [Streptomyces sp. CA-278952]